MATNQFLGNSYSKNTEPMIGYKCTSLNLVRTKSGKEKVFLGPLFGPSRHLDVKLHDTSHCRINVLHKGRPGKFCECGFYAYTNIVDAINHTFRNHHILVKTVAAGKIFVYDKGIRSGIQRVQDVLIQKCEAPTCSHYADRVGLFDNYRDENLTISGICPIHAEMIECRSFAWLEEKINASFEKDEPKVSVRSLKRSIVPWEGVETAANIRMRIREKKSTLMYKRNYEEADIG